MDWSMTFFEVLTEAINYFMEYGFNSEKSLEEWMQKIKIAAIQSMIPEYQVEQEMVKSMTAAYNRLVVKGGLVNKNVSKYDIERLKPKLRLELDRRILVSANLIKLNRQESISNTLRRFQGWATSIPPGGTELTDRNKTKKDIKKSLSVITFEQRRVVIDQTHKLVSNINDIVAVDNGAIAAKWHSHWRQVNYDYRKDHKERDDKIYIIRNSWADEKGYLKHPNGYTDEITQPGEEVFCRCNYQYIYNLSSVKDLLTTKGEKALQSAKITFK